MGFVADAIGGIFGGNDQQDAADTAQGLALQGFNYLTTGAGAPQANAIIDAGTTGSKNNQQVLGQLGALLGVPGSGAYAQTAQQGLSNYLNSAGYQFQRDQGVDAINSSAAARGLLNSGSTLKGITKFGQDLASTNFNNYLQQLGALGTSNLNTSAQGANMLNTIGTVGSNSGAAAGKAAIQGGDAAAQRDSGLGGLIGGGLNLLGSFLF